jgi:hypothetical protein
MERDTPFYQAYLLERMQQYRHSQIGLDHLILDIESCRPYLHLSDQQDLEYDDLLLDIDTLYALSLEKKLHDDYDVASMYELIDKLKNMLTS